MSTFLVRPSNSEKEAFRIKLTATSMLGLKLKSGDLCNLSIATNDDVEDSQHAKSAIAWEAAGNGMKDNIVQTSKFLQELHGFKLGDKITIKRSLEQLKDAEVVTLISKSSVEPLDEQNKKFWERYAELTVKSAHECLAESQVISFVVGSTREEFLVADVGVPDASICKIAGHTKICITETSSNMTTFVNFDATKLGGLENEISEARKLIVRLLSPRIPVKFRPIQGLLIYGAKGVGKTCFIDELSLGGWKLVVRWTPGMKITTSSQPTLIIIDQLDLPSSQTSSKVSIRELDRLFSTIRGKPCLVVAESRHPNDVDPYLRSEGKFASEIEIPIPTAVQRKQILSVLTGADQSLTDELLQVIADRTHGYVGADLQALLRRVLEIASERSELNLPNGESQTPGVSSELGTWVADFADMEQALRQVRPSALQEIFLETPNVRWTDIGGQHEIKRQLQNAVERPLKLAEQMRKLALKPKKGVLLYGPPGCSKTLLVRALAREAGLNFLAVKGAELISMYVGESERATREVFRKARAASPSIIFFDEIDAIASRGRSGSDLNVLTTLLNEMDGFEELKNVFVVAATNKPDSIDPALMRPGRFDNVVYIGPPDLEARTEIFQNQFDKSNYKPDMTPAEDSKHFAGQTDGFSGAEVVAICQTAAEYALDDARDYCTASDVQTAIGKTPKSITADMLANFESWNSARMR